MNRDGHGTVNMTTAVDMWSVGVILCAPAPPRPTPLTTTHPHHHHRAPPPFTTTMHHHRVRVGAVAHLMHVLYHLTRRFEAVFCECPFDDNELEKLSFKWAWKDLGEEKIASISKPCRDLIADLIVHDPTCRPSASSVLKNSWVAGQGGAQPAKEAQSTTPDAQRLQAQLHQEWGAADAESPSPLRLSRALVGSPASLRMSRAAGASPSALRQSRASARSSSPQRPSSGLPPGSPGMLRMQPLAGWPQDDSSRLQNRCEAPILLRPPPNRNC